jgi:hypothetical protein
MFIRASLDWSEAQILKHYDHDLRSVIGNLLARVTSSRLLNTLEGFESDSDSPTWDIASYALADDVDGQDLGTRSILEALPGQVERHFATLEIGKALEAIHAALDHVRPNHLRTLNSNL